MDFQSILRESAHRRKKRTNESKTEKEEPARKKMKLQHETETSVDLKFLTWNVWFEESVALVERIEAIGNYIVSLEVDVACLQEVTINILKLLWSSDWYQMGKWNCSLPKGKITKSYFNIIISRYPISDVKTRNLKSIMGRDLVTCVVSLTSQQKLCVACTHLESPVGVFAGGKEDKFSPERKQQIKQCFDWLNEEENPILFGGDMNWCDPTSRKENDGLLVLGLGWKDLWLQNKNDVGYTYDGVRNQMLTNKIRSRCDRIFWRETDSLIPLSISLIGTEPTATKYQKKTKHQIRELPVLPSDHFGVISSWRMKSFGK